MKIRFDPLWLGAFLVGGLALAVVVLLTLGAGNPFQATGHFVFYLENSAQGVDQGTGVSLDGVSVGQVDSVRVLYDRASRKSYVSVVCEISRELLTDLNGRHIRLTDRPTLEKLVHAGLRAQVQTAGIVGAQFVELAFYNPATHPPQAGLPHSKYAVVPTVPSTMTALTADVSQIAAHLRATDFPGLAKQAKQVLAAAHQQITQLHTNQLTTRIATAAGSVSQFLKSSDLRGAVAQLRDAAARIQDLTTNLNAQVRPLGNKLAATLDQGKVTFATANKTAESVRNFLTLRNQLGGQTRDLVNQLTETARTIERLAAFLERHPNALLTGREPATQSR